MLIWTAYGLLLAGVLVGVWCAITALWPSVGYTSVNDPTQCETRLLCWLCAALIGASVFCVIGEAVQ